jgi:transposase
VWVLSPWIVPKDVQGEAYVPRPRTAMRKIREVLRLRYESGFGPQQVSAATGLPRTTVRRLLEKAGEQGLSWPLPDELDDHELEVRLFGGRESSVDTRGRPVPDWEEVHREFRRPGVTLQLLWMEYKERCPEGFQYTWFTKGYRAWARQLDVVLRQEHRAGEKVFVDFAGQTIPIVDRKTGEITQTQLFVAVLGASNYTYAEAVPSQELAHWIGAHVRAFEYFGGVPQIIVPDNVKAAVTQAHRYEPELNRTFGDLAAHYGCAVIPARPRKPRDKAKVETGVLVAERWILASVRNLTFFSLEEANEAISERLEGLNERRFQKLPGCRRSLFETTDKPALQPLPEQRYQYATWKTAKVNIDYHVEVERHRYSVPYQLVGRQCEIRITTSTIEVLNRGRRVASHLRSHHPGGFTTDSAHMPEPHQRHVEWTPERIVRWGEQMGPSTTQVVQEVLRSCSHPQQGFRSCLGIFGLGRVYGAERLEAACSRALTIDSPRYRSIKSILKNNLDRQAVTDPQEDGRHRDHPNIRGADYYQ